MKKPRIKFKKGDKVWVPATYYSKAAIENNVWLTLCGFFVRMNKSKIRRRKP